MKKETALSLLVLVIFSLSLFLLLNREKTNTTNVFTSKKFGISFDIPLSDGHDVAVSEEGNKVYVSYGTSIVPTEGRQSVEVFFKDPKESFYNAIKNTILKDYKFPGCSIVKYYPYGESNLPPEITYAEITYPSTVGAEDIDSFLADSDKCNPDYDVTEGLRFFAYDINYPDRFFFFNLGLEEILTSQGQAWQYTLKVFKPEEKIN